MTSVWNHIFIEGYCVYDMAKKKFMKLAPWEDIHKDKPNYTESPNPLYKKDAI